MDGMKQSSSCDNMFLCCHVMSYHVIQGDNYLLTQQVGRYLLKVVQKVAAGQSIAHVCCVTCACDADVGHVCL